MKNLTPGLKALVKSVTGVKQPSLKTVHEYSRTLSVVEPLIQSSEKKGKIAIGRHILAFDNSNESEFVI